MKNHSKQKIQIMAAITSAMFCFVSLAAATNQTWYVDKQLGRDANDGQTAQTAFATIQKAIDVANTNDQILVAAGVYAPIVANNKPIEIRSIEGAGKTIIDGGGKSSCAQLGVQFSQPITKLCGFTLRNGMSEYGAGAFYGILEDCVLTGNTHKYGYGCGAHGCILYRCKVISNGTTGCNGGGAYRSKLYDCVISNNVASAGGGTYDSDLYNCVVANNSAVKYTGGGVNGGTCNFCKIIDNYANNTGGGIYSCRAYNCLIKGNSTGSGGSASYYGIGGGAYSSTVINSTVVDNTAAKGGAGVYGGKIYNSIVWGNVCSNGSTNEYNVSEVSCLNSCTTPLQPGGGNISDNPLFDGSVGHEYYLTENSPCLDCCYNTESREASDLDGGRRIRNYKMDMGAFEFQNGEIHSGDGRTWFVDADGNDGDGSTQENSAREIVDVLPRAFGGDKIIVAKGVYKPIAPLCMKISIESSDGPECTIINGRGEMICVNFGETEARTEYNVSSETNSIIRGFTICNGHGNSNKDIYGTSDAGGLWGGFAENCIISNNFASGSGGGALNANLYRCKLIGNMAGSGGGAYDCTLNRCLVIENGANRGGGVCGGSVVNSVIASNIASMEGGGTFRSSVVNCTVVKNMANDGAGVCNSSSTTINSIVWNNTLFDGTTESDYESGRIGNSFSNCCMPVPPENRSRDCISKDPLICEVEDGSYVISARSPCVDAGTKQATSDSYWCLGGLDYNGDYRIQNEMLDIGATEGGLTGVLVRVSHEGLGRTSGSVSAKEGDIVAVRAMQCDGHHRFVGFYVDGRPVASGIEQDGLTYSYNVRVGKKDISVIAKFDCATYYVSHNGNDANDGLSIASAKATLQSAYDVLKSGDKIVVSSGRYAGLFANRPIVATIVSESGTENTIIDGGSTQRCVRLTGSHVTMRGFTFENGYSDSIFERSDDSVYGGAAEGGSFVDCIFRGNMAKNGGACAYSTLENCILYGNRAQDVGGAAYASKAYNCIFYDNTAENYAGATYSGTLHNTIIYGNKSIGTSNIGLREVGYATMFNCIISTGQESTLTYGGGANNQIGDPQFEDASTYRFNLMESSPAIDAGNNAYVHYDEDFGGNRRIVNGRVDIGACEFQTQDVQDEIRFERIWGKWSLKNDEDFVMPESFDNWNNLNIAAWRARDRIVRMPVAGAIPPLDVPIIASLGVFPYTGTMSTIYGEDVPARLEHGVYVWHVHITEDKSINRLVADVDGEIVNMMTYPSYDYRKWIEEIYGAPPDWLSGQDREDWYLRHGRDRIEMYMTLVPAEDFSLYMEGCAADEDSLSEDEKTKIMIRGFSLGDGIVSPHTLNIRTPSDLALNVLGRSDLNSTNTWEYGGIGLFARGYSPAGMFSTGSNYFFKVASATIDSDGDGLADALERDVYGSNPNRRDSSGGGLPDGIKVLRYGLNPTVSDTDGDGYDDMEEVANGTNPTVHTAGAGQSIRYVYDDDGRLIGVFYGSGSAKSIAEVSPAGNHANIREGGAK